MDRTTRAYDHVQRARRYDVLMEIMHPNRSKMIDIVLSVLEAEPQCVVDLGSGTGILSDRLLRRFPEASVVAIDGAEAMVKKARGRLGSRARRVTFRVGDFRDLKRIAGGERVDAVVSSFALHHLGARDKRRVEAQARELLKPGGWFLNADIVVADSPVIERRTQELRVEGIVERARGRDPRFRDAGSVRRYLAEMEAREGDQPLKLSQDLRILRSAGFRDVSVFWQEFREAVWGGRR